MSEVGFSVWILWFYGVGEESEAGTTITTNELQDIIHHWLEDIPVREHIIHFRSSGDDRHMAFRMRFPYSRKR